MGYTEVASLEADVTVALGGKNRKTGKANPTEIEGYYLGNRKVTDTKKKSGFSYIHFFQTANGNVGVWGKTDLDRKLLTVTPGTMTLATFDRMVPTPNGDMYRYKVAQDKDNTIEVASSNSDAGYTEDGNPDGNVGSGNYDADEAETDEDAAQEETLTAAARKAQVEALLARGKSNGKSKN